MEEQISHRCQECGQLSTYPKSFRGEVLQCPHCRLRTTVGETAPQRTPSSAPGADEISFNGLKVGLAAAALLVGGLLVFGLIQSLLPPKREGTVKALNSLSPPSVREPGSVKTVPDSPAPTAPKNTPLFPIKATNVTAMPLQLHGWLVPGGKALYRIQTNGMVNPVMMGQGPATVVGSNIVTIRGRTMFVLNASNRVVRRLPLPASLTNVVALMATPTNRVALLDGTDSTVTFMGLNGKHGKAIRLSSKADTRSPQMDSVVVGNELVVAGSGLTRIAAVDLNTLKVRAVPGSTALGKGWSRTTFDGASLLVARRREIWSIPISGEKPTRIYSATNGPITGLHSLGKSLFMTENAVSKLLLETVFDNGSGTNGLLHRWRPFAGEQQRLMAGLNEPRNLMPLVGPGFAPIKRIKPRRPKIPAKNTAAIVVSGSTGVSRVQPNGYATQLAQGFSHTRIANGVIYSAMNRVVRVSDLNGRFLKEIPVPQGVPYYVGFEALPRNRFAFLDNRYNSVHFTDESGRYLRRVVLSRADNHLQNMDGVVVGNELVISGDGQNRLVAINLLTYAFRVLKTGMPRAGAVTYENGFYYFGSGKSIWSMSEKTMKIQTIGTLPKHNATGIAVNGDKLFIVVNGLLESKTSLRNKRATRNGELYEFNLNSKSVRKVRSGLDFPQGVDLLK